MFSNRLPFFCLAASSLYRVVLVRQGLGSLNEAINNISEMAIYGIETYNWQSSYLNIKRPSEICNKSFVFSWSLWASEIGVIGAQIMEKNRLLTGFIFGKKNNCPIEIDTKIEKNKKIVNGRTGAEIESQTYCFTGAFVEYLLGIYSSRSIVGKS